MNAFISLAAYDADPKIAGYGFAKSLDFLNGKTLIEHQVEALRSNGINRIYIAIPKGQEAILDAFGKNDDLHLITLSASLSTAGALAFVPKDEDLLFVPGNLVFDVNLPPFFQYHQKKGAYMTCFTHPEPHPESKDVLVARNDGQGFIILPKETTSARDFYYKNLIPTDLCILSPDILETLDEDDPCPMDIRKEILEPSLAIESLFAYQSSDYVKAIVDERSKNEIEKDLSRGIVQKRNTKRPQKAFFLDRDGTINVFGGFVTEPDMLVLIPGAAKAIRRINEEGHLAILATNQPVVARGETTIETMRQILARLEVLLGKEGAYLDGIYFCPHFPRAVEGSNPTFTQVCDCRKPKIGMLLKAKSRYNIDFSSSWFIGDTMKDVQTGLNAGTHTALLLGGDPNPTRECQDAKPEKIYTTLEQAIDDILAKN